MKTLIGRKIIAFLAILALILSSAALFGTAVNFSAESTVASAEVVLLADEDENPGEDPNEDPEGDSEGDENQDDAEEEVPAVPMDTSIAANAVGIVVLVLVAVCALFALILALSDKNKGSAAKKAPKKN